MNHYQKVFMAILLAVFFVGCSGKTHTINDGVTYSSARPAVYKDDHIRRVAVLSFGHEGFTDYFTEKLVHNSKWKVVDKAVIQRILLKQNLQDSDQLDKYAAAKVGKLANVDLVIFGDYRGNNALVKAIDVDSAEYLAYKNVPLYGKGLNWKSMQAITAILPHTVKYEGERPTYVWWGPTGDSVLERKAQQVQYEENYYEEDYVTDEPIEEEYYVDDFSDSDNAYYD